MVLKICGAAKEVTGSSFLLNEEILIDCGLWQGSRFSEDKNYLNFPFNPARLKLVILTHAHLDHCGRLPKLVKEGFRGKILATAATLDFAKIMLEDSIHIINESNQPLYQKEDLLTAERLFSPIEYHQRKTFGDYEICLYDAGHILGSSIVEIKQQGKTIIFSGDLGNPPIPILKDTEFITAADYLLIESTYGGRIHEDYHERRLLLRSAIYETITLKGVLMIPAFALERTQEILYELNDLIERGDIPKIPIFVDSPLAIKATAIFKKHEDLFDQEASNLIKKGDDIFNFPCLKLTATVEESKAINEVLPPKVIIAGSGMCHGGRIIHHLSRYLEDWCSQVLFVGYQIKGSLGRRLLDKEKKVKIFGQEKSVRAKIRAIGAYSAHPDQLKLCEWIGKIRNLKRIFIVHGEPEQAEVLKNRLPNKKADIPFEGETFVL